MVSWIFVNIGSGNGLVPDDTKSIHESSSLEYLESYFSEILSEN